MSQPLRSAFNVAVFLSALLFVAGLVVWAASWADGVALNDGQVLLFHVDDPQGTFLTTERDWHHLSTAGAWRMLRRSTKTQDWHERLGFGFGRGTARGDLSMPAFTTSFPGSSFSSGDVRLTFNVRFQLIAFPAWVVPLVAAVLPACWVLGRWRGRTRARHNRCIACGYDLRATPDRCPECGTVPGTVPAKGAA